MKKNIQLPDYNRSIISISESIMKYYGLEGNYASLTELDNILDDNYQNVVLLILDCLGDNILNDNLTENSLLKTNKLTTVTSVFPPTTAAATTAIHSGISPLESGWIGWMPYYKEFGRAIEMFSGKDFYTGEQIIKDNECSDLNYETIYEKICKKNKDVIFHQYFPSFAINGSKTFSELCQKIKISCDNNDRNLISAYWDDPDHAIHRYGTNSTEVKEVVKDIDDNLKQLSKELKDTLIVVTADHGAINLEQVYINEIKELNDCLSFPPTIESRFVNFFIKDGMHDKFRRALEDNFKDKYIIYTKEEFLKTGLLGNGIPHKRIDSYFGDYIIIMNSDRSIRYSMTEKIDKIHLADHSGITKEEMMVPVIAIKCKKKTRSRKRKYI